MHGYNAIIKIVNDYKTNVKEMPWEYILLIFQWKLKVEW